MPIESHEETVATTGKEVRENQAGMIGVTSLREAMDGGTAAYCRGRVEKGIIIGWEIVLHCFRPSPFRRMGSAEYGPSLHFAQQQN